MRAKHRPYLIAAAAPLLVAAARFFPLPALLDAATLRPAEGFHLALPPTHLALTPFATLGDLAACSSLPQAASLLGFLLALFGLAAWAAAGYGAHEWRDPVAGLRALAAWLFVVAALLSWGVLFPRAPARIEADDPDLMAVDFHSHTSYSHDGRGWFSPPENLRWHGRAGFGAAFITDHNLVDGARLVREGWKGEEGGAAPLLGEELSLHGAHVLLYGAPVRADPEDYRGLEGLERFLGESRRSLHGLAVPSLPEYYEHHRGRLEQLADWGAAGFEIVAASPRGLAVPEDFRARVVELCRARNLFVTGGSDNHGYGSTSCVASFVRVPGWRALDAAGRQAAVLAALSRDGFSAVRVVARARPLTRPVPRGGWALAVEAPRALWDAARRFTGAQAALCALWFWALAAAASAAARNPEIR